MIRQFLKFNLLVLILFLNNSTIYSQNIEFGFGFTLEHPQKIEYERNHGTINLHKIYIPITVFRSIRVIPEISFWDADYSFNHDSYKYSVFHAGVGIYYFIPLDSTHIYIGPRFAFVDIENPSKNRPQNIITSKSDNIFGLTFGVEHKIIKNISIGFEIQYNYYEINPWTKYGYEKITIRRALETMFVFAFHL